MLATTSGRKIDVPDKAMQAELKIDDKVLSSCPSSSAAEDEHGDRHRQASRQDRQRDAGPGVHEHRLDEERDHVPRRRAGASCATAASPSSSWRRSRPSSRSPTCSSTATCPSKAELAAFSGELTRHSMIHEDMKRFFDGYPGTAHPMAILSAMVLSLSSFYPEALDVKNHQEQEATIARLLSKVRTIAAFSYKKSIGQPFVYPKNSAQLLRELPQHDVLGPGGAVRDRRGDREGAEPAADPARGSRAELQHVDGAHGRQLAGEPVRVDLGRHLRALGAAARRRQRRGAGDAGGDPAPTAAAPRSSSTWPRRRTRASG